MPPPSWRRRSPVGVSTSGWRATTSTLTYVEDDLGPAAAPTGESDEQSARISLRLGESLKARLESSAAADGVSVNTFIVRTLERGTSNNRARGARAGNRLRGYGTT